MVISVHVYTRLNSITHYVIKLWEQIIPSCVHLLVLKHNTFFSNRYYMFMITPCIITGLLRNLVLLKNYELFEVNLHPHSQCLKLINIYRFVSVLILSYSKIFGKLKRFGKVFLVHPCFSVRCMGYFVWVLPVRSLRCLM